MFSCELKVHFQCGNDLPIRFWYELFNFIVLDEIFVAISLKLIPLAGVLGLLEARPENVSLILTGRGAPPEVIERADTVTEMAEVKHAFQRGIPALRGIDF